MTRWLLVSGAMVVLVLGPGCEAEKPMVPEPVAKAPEPVKEVPKAPPGLTFAKKALAVGMKLEESTKMLMSMTMSVDLTGKGKAKEASMETTEAETKTEEILAVAGNAPTKVKVTYSEKTNVMKEGGKEQKVRSPLAGKTYIVEAKDGKIVVLNDKEKPAPAKESKLVQEDYATLGKPDPFLEAMPTRPLKPGDKVDELVAALKEEMKREAKDMEVGNVTVTFKEKQADEGVFDVAFQLSKVEAPMKFVMDLKGDMRLKLASSQPTSMTMSGPVTISAAPGPKAKAQVKVDGKGKMDLSVTMKAL